MSESLDLYDFIADDSIATHHHGKSKNLLDGKFGGWCGGFGGIGGISGISKMDNFRLACHGSSTCKPQYRFSTSDHFVVDRFEVENSSGTRIEICRLGKQRRPGCGITKHCTMRASRVFLCVGFFKRIFFGLLIEKICLF
jgi:hypothetical protein